MTELRLQNIYWVASDIARLSQFYEKALQFTLKFSDGDKWVQYSVGESNVALASIGEAPADVRGPVLVFEVTDVETVRAQAIRAGAHFIGERDMGSHGRTLTFEDPEGNVFQLFCRPT